MGNKFHKILDFRKLILILLLLIFFLIKTFAQEDTLYVHISETIDFYPINQIDSITFHYGEPFSNDTMYIWAGSYFIAKYVVNDIDSISFHLSPSIYPPLIAYCTGIPYITDFRDNEMYHTVKIGNQCWLRENLRYLPEVYSVTSESYDHPRYYVYNYIGTDVLNAKAHPNYSLFGVLYNHPAAIISCPKGWRLPNKSDWDSLKNFLIVNQYNFDNTFIKNRIAKSMVGSQPVSISGLWNNAGTVGSPGNIDYEFKRNSSGFSVLPSGFKFQNYFSNLYNQSYFWSHQIPSNPIISFVSIAHDSIALIQSNTTYKEQGFSVRCIAKSLEIKTKPLSLLNYNCAQIEGSLQQGAEPIIEKGFYWKKVADSNWNSIIISQDSLTYLLTNLDSNTTYHYFAFVRIINGVFNGDTLNFTTYNNSSCPGLITYLDNRDNEIYSTVLIGRQCWMKQNLRHLPTITATSSTSTGPKYFVYGYNGTNLQEAKASANYGLMGVLYNMAAALNGETYSNTIPSGVKGICPTGWHIPSEDEFNEMISRVAPPISVAPKLKSTTLWLQNGNGNNSSFFSAYPSGRFNANIFENYGYGAFFWTSTKWGTETNPRVFFLTSTSNAIFNSSYNENSNLSIRCVKNELILQIDSIKNITYNSALIFGTNAPGIDSVYNIGIKWKSSNTSQWNTLPTSGVKYSIQLNNLIENTLYDIVGFIETINGVQYGDTSQFITLSSPPTLGVPQITYTDTTQAFVKCPMTPGTLPILLQKIYYTPAESSTWNIIQTFGAPISDTITGLQRGTLYKLYIVIDLPGYSITSSMIYFSTTLNGPCPGILSFMDTRDSSIYKTVNINGTCWMKENLRYLPAVSPGNIGSSSLPHFYVFDYNGTDVQTAKSTTNYQKTGVLYNRAATLNGDPVINLEQSITQGICPNGWYIPTHQDWQKLRTFLQSDTNYYIPTLGSQSIALSLSTNNGNTWLSSNTVGSPGNNQYQYKRDLSGLSIMPGGQRTSAFLGYNEIGEFWSTKLGSQFGSGTYVVNYMPEFSVIGDNIFKSNGVSVRCIKYVKPLALILPSINVTSNQATLVGTIISGVEPVISKGFVWKLASDTTWNTIFEIGDTMFSTLTGLSNGLNYHVKSFAITQNDTIYSLLQTFTTMGFVPCTIPTINDPRDNNLYNTIQIGTQCWLRENVRYLPSVFPSDSISSVIPRYYVYGYNGTNITSAQSNQNYSSKGVLYNYEASKNACPEGWHIPLNNEWDTIIKFLTISGYNYDETLTGNKIAKALSGSTPQSTGGYWANSQNAGTPGSSDYPNFRNLSGYSALPSGCNNNGVFEKLDSISTFWSSTQILSSNFFTYNVKHDNVALQNQTVVASNAYSVRCVKNINSTVTLTFSNVTSNFVYLLSVVNKGNDSIVNYISKIKQLGSDIWQNQYIHDLNYILTYYPNFNYNQYTPFYQLESNTTYQSITYLYTNRDTIVSDTVTFTTLPAPPSYSGIGVYEQEIGSVKVKAFLNPGSSAVLNKGFEYKHIDSTTWTQILTSNDTIDYQLNGLMQKTKYNIRLFVHNVDSLSYSNISIFSTLWNNPCPNNATFMDSRDSNVYRTIQIGNQCWMKENLRYLPSVSHFTSNSVDTAYYFVYGVNDTSLVNAKLNPNYLNLGVLYNWTAAVNGSGNSSTYPSNLQGICPTGWHLPSKLEFDTLSRHLKNNSYSCSTTNNTYLALSLSASLPMNIGGLWETNTNTPMSPGNISFLEKRNISGFSIIPSGYKTTFNFQYLNFCACFWTSTINSSTHSYSLNLYSSTTLFSISTSQKEYGYSVRCVKDY